MIAYNTATTSPNRSSRDGVAVSLLVLHATVGSFASSIAWLCNPASKASTNYLIDRNGSIYQLVPESEAAWHAGRSAHHGMDSGAIQHASIGIELVNKNDGHDPYPIAQLDSCRLLCRDRIARYAIARGDVVRHLDIATPRGRKTDPAGFPWIAFVESCYADAPPGPSSHPPVPPLHSYIVSPRATGGASIRAYPRTSAAILGRLHAGDEWSGDEVQAATATFVAGFGSSRTWVSNPTRGFVWAGLLERVKES